MSVCRIHKSAKSFFSSSSSMARSTRECQSARPCTVRPFKLRRYPKCATAAKRCGVPAPDTRTAANDVHGLYTAFLLDHLVVTAGAPAIRLTGGYGISWRRARGSLRLDPHRLDHLGP